MDLFLRFFQAMWEEQAIWLDDPQGWRDGVLRSCGPVVLWSSLVFWYILFYLIQRCCSANTADMRNSWFMVVPNLADTLRSFRMLKRIATSKWDNYCHSTHSNGPMQHAIHQPIRGLNLNSTNLSRATKSDNLTFLEPATLRDRKLYNVANIVLTHRKEIRRFSVGVVYYNWCRHTLKTMRSKEIICSKCPRYDVNTTQTKNNICFVQYVADDTYAYHAFLCVCLFSSVFVFLMLPPTWCYAT